MRKLYAFVLELCVVAASGKKQPPDKQSCATLRRRSIEGESDLMRNLVRHGSGQHRRSKSTHDSLRETLSRVPSTTFVRI